MKVKITLKTGSEYEIDLAANSIFSLQELDDKIEFSPNKPLKTENGTRVLTNAIVVYKELTNG